MKEHSDADLVLLSAQGDRDAFGEVVRRYQSLICSITYSGTGNLATSEDLAQETFVTAWKKIKGLDEPGKFKSWICGIARNLIRNSHRKGTRTPTHQATSMDDLQNTEGQEAPPFAKTISDEEQAILWRSIEEIPENYREPLVLYYREGQSIEDVALALDISEDNARQRLARGRRMLQAQVSEFVETTLMRSAPGKAFTMAVLASLPLFSTSVKAATVATAATKGSAVAKSATVLSVASALLGPLVGMAGAWIGYKSSLNGALSEEERKYIKRHTRYAIVGAVFFNLLLIGTIFLAGKHWATHPKLIFGLSFGIIATFVVAILYFAFRMNRQMALIREQQNPLDASGQRAPAYERKEYISPFKLLGLPLIHTLSGARENGRTVPAIGWIAIGEKAYGLLFAAGGIAIAPIAGGGLAIGAVSFGGAAIGLLFAMGGAAIGCLAVGGIAVGAVASGGLAMGYLLAEGGFAVSKQYAVGGLTLGAHCNDVAAKAYAATFSWIDFTRAKTRNAVAILAWLPMIMFGLISWRKKKKANQP